MLMSPHHFRRVKSVISVAGFVAILVMFIVSGGSGECEQTVNTVAFSPDGSYLAAGMFNSRDAQVPMKCYDADVCRTVELISMSRPNQGHVVVQTFRPGNQGPLDRMTPVIEFVG